MNRNYQKRSDTRRERLRARARHRAVAPTRAMTTTTGPSRALRGSSRRTSRCSRSSADMEGEVNILAWPGYAEDGSTDPAVDWVTPFEEDTGCQANVKYFATSDEAVQLMKTGEYDVVSASGDASLRLIAAGDVGAGQHRPDPQLRRPLPLPQGPRLELRRRPDVRRAARLRRQPADVAHRRGQPAPTSWSVVFDDASDYAGKVTAYDSPIYIADAALYLMKHPARPGHRAPLRARRGPARGGRRPAQGSSGRTSGSTGRTTSRRSRPSRPATPSSARPGRSSPTSPRARACRSR